MEERLKQLRAQEAELVRVIPTRALHIQARLQGQLRTIREEIQKLQAALRTKKDK